MKDFIKKLRFKLWDLKDYRKHRRVHIQAKKLMDTLEKNGSYRYSMETEDQRMRLEWTKKKD